jgi:DNA replication and repair protein RecF
MRDQGIENITHGQAWARIDALTDTSQSRVIKLEPIGEKLSIKYEIDELAVKRMATDDKIPVVIFEPNHLQLITTSPDHRRSFIDGILSQIDEEFARQKRQYQRVLSQRNSLLKKGRSNARAGVFAWNIRLSELGGLIATKRQELLKKISKDLSQSYSSIAKTKHNLSIHYASKLPLSSYASKLLQNLEQDFEKDLLRGFTSSGPHRDDIEISINGRLLQKFSSRGESRTTMLALKIQETKLLEAFTGKKPLLLLDDVFGELDGTRRKMLTNFIASHQSFITTTDADIVGKSYGQKALLIKLK